MSSGLVLKGIAHSKAHFVVPKGQTTIGSGANADIVLSDPTVSRQHAILRWQKQTLWIQDSDSTNGTQVNDKPVTHERALRVDDEISFGRVRFRLSEVESEDARIALSVASDDQQDAGTTLPPRVSDQFTQQDLPRILDALAGGLQPYQLAEQYGRMLYRQPGVVEVRIGQDQLVLSYCAQENLEDAQRLETFSCGPFQIELATNMQYHPMQYLPLVNVLQRLLPFCTSPPKWTEERVQPKSTDSINPRMQLLYRQLSSAAQSDLNVLILGETGTGKEVFAKALHQQSGRTGELIAINCAALSDALLEAELFGIEKGVATGVTARDGCIRAADGGTLFLDEVGDMPAAVQIKLLRVLQEKQVYPVGSSEPVAVDVRVVSATHQNLQDLRNTDRFRLDLYHRLADWEVELPALRERPEDIPNLALTFLQRQLHKQSKPSQGITQAALDALKRYPWPGNVRELEREMARCAVFLEQGSALTESMLSSSIRESGKDAGGLEQQLLDAEKSILQTALSAQQGNATAAARTLQISRSTFYRRLKAVGLAVDQVADADEDSGK